jgi:hypothetical protein
MFASFFGKLNHTSRNGARSRQLEVETLEARSVPSTFATLVDAVGTGAWSPAPARQVREMVVDGAMVHPSGNATVQGGAMGDVTADAGIDLMMGTRKVGEEVPA